MMKKVGITPGPVLIDSMESSDVKQFNPANTGSTGQVLTKTAGGYNWQDASGGGGGSSDVGFSFTNAGYESYGDAVGHIDILVDDPETFNALITYSLRVADSTGTGAGTDLIPNLTASVVFSREVGDTTYFADGCLSGYDTNTGINNKYKVLIIGTFKASAMVGEDISISLDFGGTAVFSKTAPSTSVLQDIASVSIDIQHIDICVNQ